MRNKLALVAKNFFQRLDYGGCTTEEAAQAAGGGGIGGLISSALGSTLGWVAGGSLGSVLGGIFGSTAGSSLTAPSGGTTVVAPPPAPELVTKNMNVGSELDPLAKTFNPEDEEKKRKAVNKKKLGAKALQIPLESDTSIAGVDDTASSVTAPATTGVQL